MKIHITDTSPIGERCKLWGIQNLPSNFEYSKNIDDCDILFSIFHNKLFSEEFISSKKKCFNFHGGIAPYYRGSGTINFAIINGEKETGVTLHEIDRFIDHGDIIDVQKITIEDKDTADSLYKKMEIMIFEMFKNWFIKLINLDYKAKPQDHSKARLYQRKDLQEARNLTKFAKAFDFSGKEQAYYFNKEGEKIFIKY
jgi:methionyl-tRNA formyltransferase